MRGVEVVFNSLAKSMVRLTIGKELLSVLRIVTDDFKANILSLS
jgi:hypothetical protein